VYQSKNKVSTGLGHATLLDAKTTLCGIDIDNSNRDWYLHRQLDYVECKKCKRELEKKRG
jgi:hypothetical protein